MSLRWPALSARLRRRRIAGLRYDPGPGYAVIELADGGELWVQSSCPCFLASPCLSYARITRRLSSWARPQPGKTSTWRPSALYRGSEYPDLLPWTWPLAHTKFMKRFQKFVRSEERDSRECIRARGGRAVFGEEFKRTRRTHRFRLLRGTRTWGSEGSLPASPEAISAQQATIISAAEIRQFPTILFMS